MVVIIYKITNTINGKIYIGKYQGNNFNNYWGSGKILKNAYKKYGRENFTKEIIYECDSEEELVEKEKYYIQCFNSIRPNGYNIAEGGNGGNVRRGYTEEENNTYNQKISSGLKNKYENDDYFRELSRTRAIKMLANKNSNFGFKNGHTPFNKDKTLSEKHITNLSESHKGHKHTQEIKNKISQSMKGNKISNKNKEINAERLSRKVLCVDTNIIFKSIKEAYQSNKNSLNCCFNTFKKKLHNGEIQNDNRKYIIID